VRRLPTRLGGPVLLEPEVFADERGFFLETFHRARYLELGIGADFVQDNHSRSVQGTIRGLHLQLPPGQPKLVRVARGRVFDVVVDLRPESQTFGNWESFELDDERHHQLFVPGGFAHGFCVLSETCDFVYKVGSYYDPATERGLAWDDPELSIQWPVRRPIVSTRDQMNPSLRELVAELRR
jgi:dTDP-4-dehydrorhamnose 3,5-epimerase